MATESAAMEGNRGSRFCLEAIGPRGLDHGQIILQLHYYYYYCQPWLAFNHQTFSLRGVTLRLRASVGSVRTVDGFSYCKRTAWAVLPEVRGAAASGAVVPGRSLRFTCY